MQPILVCLVKFLKQERVENDAPKVGVPLFSSEMIVT